MISESLPYTPDWTKTPKCGDYRAIKCSDHPRAWTNGYIHLHIVVAEIKIGRLLRNNEEVHHRDENKFNNDPENLDVLDGIAHKRLHGEKYKNPITLICDKCGITFQRKRNQRKELKGGKHQFCSRVCFNQFRTFSSSKI